MSDDWIVAFWGHGDVVASGQRVIRSRARSAFGNYSPPARFNCLCEQGMGGLEGRIGLPAFAASILSLWVLRGQRGAWVLRISNILGL